MTVIQRIRRRSSTESEIQQQAQVQPSLDVVPDAGELSPSTVCQGRRNSSLSFAGDDVFFGNKPSSLLSADIWLSFEFDVNGDDTTAASTDLEDLKHDDALLQSNDWYTQYRSSDSSISLASIDQYSHRLLQQAAIDNGTKQVTFGSITFHSFPPAIGDNPAVSSGVPIALSYRRGQTAYSTVDAHERYRSSDCCGRRRRGRELHIDRNEREQMLLAYGYTQQEITDAALECKKYRVHRRNKKKEVERGYIADGVDKRTDDRSDRPRIRRNRSLELLQSLKQDGEGFSMMPTLKMPSFSRNVSAPVATGLSVAGGAGGNQRDLLPRPGQRRSSANEAMTATPSTVSVSETADATRDYAPRPGRRRSSLLRPLSMLQLSSLLGDVDVDEDDTGRDGIISGDGENTSFRIVDGTKESCSDAPPTPCRRRSSSEKTVGAVIKREGLFRRSSSKIFVVGGMYCDDDVENNNNSLQKAPEKRRSSILNPGHGLGVSADEAPHPGRRRLSGEDGRIQAKPQATRRLSWLFKKPESSPDANINKGQRRASINFPVGVTSVIQQDTLAESKGDSGLASNLSYNGRPRSASLAMISIDGRNRVPLVLHGARRSPKCAFPVTFAADVAVAEHDIDVYGYEPCQPTIRRRRSLLSTSTSSNHNNNGWETADARSSSRRRSSSNRRLSLVLGVDQPPSQLERQASATHVVGEVHISTMPIRRRSWIFGALISSHENPERKLSSSSSLVRQSSSAKLVEEESCEPTTVVVGHLRGSMSVGASNAPVTGAVGDKSIHNESKNGAEGNPRIQLERSSTHVVGHAEHTEVKSPIAPRRRRLSLAVVKPFQLDDPSLVDNRHKSTKTKDPLGAKHSLMSCHEYSETLRVENTRQAELTSGPPKIASRRYRKRNEGKLEEHPLFLAQTDSLSTITTNEGEELLNPTTAGNTIRRGPRPQLIHSRSWSSGNPSYEDESLPGSLLGSMHSSDSWHAKRSGSAVFPVSRAMVEIELFGTPSPLFVQPQEFNFSPQALPFRSSMSIVQPQHVCKSNPRLLRRTLSA